MTEYIQHRWVEREGVSTDIPGYPEVFGRPTIERILQVRIREPRIITHERRGAYDAGQLPKKLDCPRLEWSGWSEWKDVEVAEEA